MVIPKKRRFGFAPPAVINILPQIQSRNPRTRAAIIPVARITEARIAVRVRLPAVLGVAAAPPAVVPAAVGKTAVQVRRLYEILLVIIQEQLNRVLQRTVELAAGRVFVPATVEHFAAEDIYRPVALTTHRNLNLLFAAVGKGLLRFGDLVLAHEAGIIDILYLHGHIDDALRVAGLEIKAV